MTKTLTLLSLICAVPITVNAQNECGTGRYSDPAFFSTVTVLSGVQYGSNTGVNGQPQNLFMDVYMPAGDTLTDRPVVIVGFGGSFVAGTRQDVADLCELFAKRGFVAVAPDYRVGFFFPTEATTTRAVLRSMHDMKGCVRFLRKSVDIGGDPYGIDPSRIIVGGVSAGAIGAIHAAYLDQSSEIPPILYPDTASIGGVEGNSGSLGYSSDVLACYSFSGAIGDTTWVQAGDQPLCSVHEVGDGVVPYGTQMVSVLGIPTGLTASGSSDIHVRFANLAIPNCFLSYPGNGHVGYLTSDPVNSFNFVADFCAELVCGQTPSCGAISTGVAHTGDGQRLIAFPNPASDRLTLQVDDAVDLVVLTSDGRMVAAQRLNKGTNTIDLSGLPEGLYILRAGSLSTRVLKVGR
jgi:hypothetical protein